MIDNKVRRMYLNILGISRLPNSNIVCKRKRSFSAELLVRNGRYKFRIDYIVGNPPQIYLVEPVIHLDNPIEFHTYGYHYHGAYNKNLLKLCLTRISDDGLHPDIPITETYIPWAIEWTEFYELKLLTGMWHGKGVHLSEDETKREEQVYEKMA